MNEQSSIGSAPLDQDHLTVAKLRRELGLTLAEMGERVGLSKSQMHEVERTNGASLRVALAIEQLSGARIDAAELCEEVRLSRHGCAECSPPGALSPGNSQEISRESRGAARTNVRAAAASMPPGGHG